MGGPKQSKYTNDVKATARWCPPGVRNRRQPCFRGPHRDVRPRPPASAKPLPASSRAPSPFAPDRLHVEIAPRDRPHHGALFGSNGFNGCVRSFVRYGYGIKANSDWKATLGERWRQYEETFPAFAARRIDRVSLECRKRVPIELIGLLKGKDVLVGCIDVASNVVETPPDVAHTIRAALDYVPADRLYPCTNCGMAPTATEIAYAKLAALAAGAEFARKAVQ